MAGPLSRRELLRTGTAAAFASLAGCATIEAELGLRTQRLGRVTLANSVGEPIEVQVEVLRDGTLVYESAHQLEPGSPAERTQTVIYEWRDDPDARSWEVRAKTPTSEWRNAELDAAVGGRDDCYSVKIVTGDPSEEPVLVVPGGCESSA